MKRVNTYRLLLLLMPFWLLPLSLLAQANSPQSQQATDSNAATYRSFSNQAGEFSDAPKAVADQPALGEVFSVWEILRPLVMLVAGFLLIYVITLLLQLWADRSNQHRPGLLRLIPIVQVVGWALLILLLIITTFEPSGLVLLAIWLSVGLALAFAAQELVRSFLGGIILLLEKPFQPGDKIEIGPFSGEVQHIGLRTTRILTADDSVLTVPNSELVNQPVNNASTGEPNCQVVAELYLPLGINTTRVREIAFEAAHVSRYIYQEKPVGVYFVNEVKQKKSWLKMRLKAHVMDLRYELDFKSEITEIVMRELIREGLLQEGLPNQEIL